MTKIYLFTISFPYDNAETFLESEMSVVSEMNDVEIELVPFFIGNNIRKLPSNVSVNNSLGEALEKNSEKKVYTLIPSFLKIVKGLMVHRALSISAIRDIAGFVHHGRLIKKWALKNITETDSVLYTYWFERITYGLSLFKKISNKPNCLITRAHGFDLYPDRRTHNFIPFRRETLGFLDRIFTVSAQGKAHLIADYGCFDLVDVSFLGVNDEKTFPNSENGIVRFVSCSSIIGLKRVDLIAKVVKSFSERNPEKNIEWNHFGDGEEESVDKLEYELADLGSNLRVIQHGTVSNKEVIDFYNQNYVDAFINLSTTEGLPVSIMEAISFEIPILAVDVGGVSEIVNSSNGILLQQNFEIADAVLGVSHIIDNHKLREGARKMYVENFVAQKNYIKFYQQIREIANGK